MRVAVQMFGPNDPERRNECAECLLAFAAQKRTAKSEGAAAQLTATLTLELGKVRPVRAGRKNKSRRPADPIKAKVLGSRQVSKAVWRMMFLKITASLDASHSR